MKLAQLFKLYNFASRNIFKFCLHFEIWIWGAFEYLNHFKITPNFICKLEKTLNTKVDPYKISSNFAFCHNPKFQMDFEISKRGKKDFYNLKLNSNLIWFPIVLNLNFWPITWPIRVIWVKWHMITHDHMNLNPCGHDLYLGFLKHITWNNNIMK